MQIVQMMTLHRVRMVNNRWKSRLLAGTTSSWHNHEVMARTVMVNWNGGSLSAATDKADYLGRVLNQDMPEPGTVFRTTTTKPLATGDVFVIDTAPYRTHHK